MITKVKNLSKLKKLILILIPITIVVFVFVGVKTSQSKDYNNFDELFYEDSYVEDDLAREYAKEHFPADALDINNNKPVADDLRKNLEKDKSSQRPANKIASDINDIMKRTHTNIDVTDENLAVEDIQVNTELSEYFRTLSRKEILDYLDNIDKEGAWDPMEIYLTLDDDIRFIIENDDLSNIKFNGKFYESVDDLPDIGLKRPTLKSETTDKIDLYSILPILYKMPTSDSIRDKAVRLSMNEYPNQANILELFTQDTINQMINGTFNWSYENTDNKKDFLFYRGEGYFYDGEPCSTEDMYDQIHDKIKRHGLIIKTEFELKENGVFIEPKYGGYNVAGTLKFTYSSSKGSKLYNYEPDTTYETDVELSFNYLMKTNDLAPLEREFWYSEADMMLGITDTYLASDFK